MLIYEYEGGDITMFLEIQIVQSKTLKHKEKCKWSACTPLRLGRERKNKHIKISGKKKSYA